MKVAPKALKLGALKVRTDSENSQYFGGASRTGSIGIFGSLRIKEFVAQILLLAEIVAAGREKVLLLLSECCCAEGVPSLR